MITIQDLIDNGTEMYNILIREFNEESGYAENLYEGSAYDVPKEYRKKDIKYIYATRYGDGIRVVFEI